MDNSILYIHRNHHFDTIQRLHPLMHPLNTRRWTGYNIKCNRQKSKDNIADFV